MVERIQIQVDDKDVVEAAKALDNLADKFEEAGDEAKEFARDAKKADDATKGMGSAAGGMTTSLGGLVSGLGLAAGATAALTAAAAGLRIAFEQGREAMRVWAEETEEGAALAADLSEQLQTTQIRFAEAFTQTQLFKDALQGVNNLFEVSPALIKILTGAMDLLYTTLKETTELLASFAGVELDLEENSNGAAEAILSFAEAVEELNGWLEWINDTFGGAIRATVEFGKEINNLINPIQIFINQVRGLGDALVWAGEGLGIIDEEEPEVSEALEQIQEGVDDLTKAVGELNEEEPAQTFLDWTSSLIQLVPAMARAAQGVLDFFEVAADEDEDLPNLTRNTDAARRAAEQYRLELEKGYTAFNNYKTELAETAARIDAYGESAYNIAMINQELMESQNQVDLASAFDEAASAMENVIPAIQQAYDNYFASLSRQELQRIINAENADAAIVASAQNALAIMDAKRQEDVDKGLQAYQALRQGFMAIGNTIASNSDKSAKEQRKAIGSVLAAQGLGYLLEAPVAFFSKGGPAAAYAYAGSGAAMLALGKTLGGKAFGGGGGGGAAAAAASQQAPQDIQNINNFNVSVNPGLLSDPRETALRVADQQRQIQRTGG